MHAKYSRTVTIVLDHAPSIQLTKRRGGILRHIILENIKTLYVSTSDSGFMLVVVPNDYDLVAKNFVYPSKFHWFFTVFFKVLHFDNDGQSHKFLSHLEQMMNLYNKNVRISHTGTDALLRAAETRETRQKKLEHFFREAYAQVWPT